MSISSRDLATLGGKPQASRLKSLGLGIRVKAVLGKRILVKTVDPYTEMDRVEEQKLIHIPEKVKEANKPLPTTGFVVAHGHAMTEAEQQLLPIGAAVMFSKIAGSEWTMNNEDYRVIDLQEILGVLEMEEENG